MKRILAAAAVVLVSTVSSGAAGYDDFTRGMTANLRGDYAVAVTAFTTALAAPDLVTAYRPAAYRARASAYLNLDACDKARSDLAAYQALKPDDKSIAGLRMWVDLCLKDNVAARRDFDSLGTGTFSARDLWGFSRLQWRYGLFDEAAATGREAFKAVAPDDGDAAYILLWLAVSEQRAGKLDTGEIAAGLKSLKRSDWPKPVIDLYLGTASAESILKEAESWHTQRETAQRCEANFYTAEWLLGQNSAAPATPLLLEVVRSCPIDFSELSAAKAELKRLGVPVPKE